LIDPYYIFRSGTRVPWWDIRNYLARGNPQDGLHAFVKQKHPKFIDASTDPFPEHDIVSVVEEHGLHELAPVLVPNFEMAQRYRNLNFVYYPICILSAIQRNQQAINIDSNRHQRLSCLNRQPRLHRFLIYYELAQRPWFNEVHLSFAGLNTLLGGCGDILDLDQLDIFDAVVKSYFLQHQSSFPITSQDDYQWQNCHSAEAPAYSTCWANLATETSVHAFCITEKTTKPLRAGCLFFPASSQGFIDGINRIGFDLNYRGIQLDFDQEPNWMTRVQLCVKEIDRVYKDIIDIWHDNRQQIKYNSDLFLSNQLLEHCLQDVKQYV
jgi:hypothetical protein